MWPNNIKGLLIISQNKGNKELVRVHYYYYSWLDIINIKNKVCIYVILNKCQLKLLVYFLLED